MPSGGARIRSGPMPKEDSARSEARGYKLTALPETGYDGPVPEWPLPTSTKRERDMWEWAWSLPQGAAWSLPENQFLWPAVAMYCRVFVRAEARNAPVGVLTQLHRFADQVGLTTASLAAMGWKISDADAGEVQAPSARAVSSRSRLKMVKNAG